jgi:hypothetical protein
MVQAPRIQELNPFLRCFCSFLPAFFHHSAKEDLLLGVNLDKSSYCNMAHQNCLANTRVVSKCWIDSSSWSQRRHFFGCGIPLFRNQSTVQQRFHKASHTNVLHFPGALSKVIKPEHH